MPDYRAEINRGIAEAVRPILNAANPEDAPDIGEVLVINGSGEWIDFIDFTSSLDAGVEACAVLGLEYIIRPDRAKVWNPKLVISSGVFLGEADTPALALARAVWDAVK